MKRGREEERVSINNKQKINVAVDDKHQIFVSASTVRQKI